MRTTQTIKSDKDFEIGDYIKDRYGRPRKIVGRMVVRPELTYLGQVGDYRFQVERLRHFPRRKSGQPKIVRVNLGTVGTDKVEVRTTRGHFAKATDPNLPLMSFTVHANRY